MSIFKERERSCEATFRSGGPYWHAYTSGKETSLLFACREDLVFVMNVVAQAAVLFPEVRIIAFEVMNNHFHFVVSADENAVLALWALIRKMSGERLIARTKSDCGYFCSRAAS